MDLRQRDDFRKGHIAGSINLCRAKSKPTMLVSLRSTKTNRYRGRWFWHAVPGACKRADEAGFAQVFVLKEGVAGWAGENCLWCAANNLPVVFHDAGR